jgi:hypothetical protein
MFAFVGVLLYFVRTRRMRGRRKSKKMRVNPRKSAIKFYVLVSLLVAYSSVYSQTIENGHYRLTTEWLGEAKSLGVVNGGANNTLQLTVTANIPGQFWKITAVGGGYFRLTAQSLGESKSLDVVNDGTNNKLQMANSGEFSGQFWKITPVENGFYRLTTQWLGEGKSLDVVNDGTNNQIKLAETGRFSGQFWKITKVSAANATTPKLRQMTHAGFRIIVREELAEKAETKRALNILTERLDVIAKILKPKHLERLKKVPIWIQYKQTPDGAMWYHPSKDWLVSNGYPAEMEKAAEIKNLKNFIDWQADQPFMVLHELAHAYADLYLGDMQTRIVAAYENAVASGKYDSVADVKGVKRRHYALTNKTEYFAELTESYLGKNDFYPFIREELRQFDSAGYKLMQEAWE